MRRSAQVKRRTKGLSGPAAAMVCLAGLLILPAASASAVTYVVDTPAEAADIGANGFWDASVDIVIRISITPITTSNLQIFAKSIVVEGPPVGPKIEIINTVGEFSLVTLHAKNGDLLISNAIIKAKKEVKLWTDAPGKNIVIKNSEVVSSPNLLPEQSGLCRGSVYMLNQGGDIIIEGSTIWGTSKVEIISKNGSVTFHCSPGSGPGGGNTECALESFYVLVDASVQDTIYHFSATGAYLGHIVLQKPAGGTFVPTDLVFDKDNSVFYVLHRGARVVLKYDMAGVLLATSKTLRRQLGVSPSYLNNPTGMAIDGDELWILSSGDKVLLRYSLAAAFAGAGDINALQEIPMGAVPNGEGLALDATYLYVINDGAPPRIYRYPRSGGPGEPSKVLKTPDGSKNLDTPAGLALCCNGSIWVVDIMDSIGPHWQKELLEYKLADLWPANGDSLNAVSMISVLTDPTHDWPQGLAVVCKKDEEPPGEKCKVGGGCSETQFNARTFLDIEGLVFTGHSHLNIFTTTGDLLAKGANLTDSSFNIRVGGNVDISDATLRAIKKNIVIDAKGDVNAMKATLLSKGTQQPVLNNKTYPNWVQPPVVTTPGTVVGLGMIRIEARNGNGVIDVSDATVQ